MGAKTLFIVITTAVLTLILVNNTGDIEIWVFGSKRVPKLAVFGTLLGLGFIFGLIVGRAGKRKTSAPAVTNEEDSETVVPPSSRSSLSDEDREYIS